MGSGKKRNEIGVFLRFKGPDASRHFERLKAASDEIEAQIGEPLRWAIDESGTSVSLSVVWKGADRRDRASWPEQHRWLRERVNRFVTAFRPRIAAMAEGEPEADAKAPVWS